MNETIKANDFKYLCTKSLQAFPYAQFAPLFEDKKIVFDNSGWACAVCSGGYLIANGFGKAVKFNPGQVLLIDDGPWGTELIAVDQWYFDKHYIRADKAQLCVEEFVHDGPFDNLTIDNDKAK